ncbi:hypothetical protein ACODM8_09555 [Vibrio ostreicida]|uniref:hypothetical protein n=1 Tax=Vibrio ostreicida TaxID=526588 RepID=UPI003B5BB910
MKKQNTETLIENVTDSINHFLKSEQSNEDYKSITTCEILRSYKNTILPNNYNQAINIIYRQVVDKKQIEQFTVALITAFKETNSFYCKLIWSEIESCADTYTDNEKTISFEIVNQYLSVSNDIQTTMYVLYAVLSELINKNKHYYIMTNRSELLEEAKLVCLTQVLIELESITKPHFKIAA